MASSVLQLLGFFLSIIGLAAIVSATLMVEWKKQHQGKHHIYEGLWMTCSGHERTTCEFHQHLLKLPTEVQVTRAVMLLSIFLSAVALIVSTLGMKCTRFMDGKPKSKAVTVVIGGIMFMAVGLLVLIITSLYIKKIVHIHHESHRLHNMEFGKAIFVNLAGGLLIIMGGAFLSCGRCSRSQSTSSISSNHLLPTTHSKSNYV